MANTKGKIIIGGVITVLVGVSTMLIIKGVKRKKVIKRIYKALNGEGSAEDKLETAKAELGDDLKHTVDVGFSTTFWEKGQDGVMPTQLMPSMYAREIAKKIYDGTGMWDNEDDILGALKQVKTKGQLSQVAYQYGIYPQNYGDLGSAITSSLGSWGLANDRLKEMNKWLATLPY